MSKALLQITALQFGYKGQAMNSPLDLTLNQPFRLAVVGENGSGKSTLLRTLLGLLPSISGKYAWDETLRLSYVAQEHQFDPIIPLTVRDLLNMAQFVYPKSKWQESFLAELKEQFKIGLLEDMLLANLSSGQKQRVLLFRGLLCCPDVLILDESWEFLDKQFRGVLDECLHTLFEQQQMSLLFVQHDEKKVKERADQILELGI